MLSESTFPTRVKWPVHISHSMPQLSGLTSGAHSDHRIKQSELTSTLLNNVFWRLMVITSTMMTCFNTHWRLGSLYSGQQTQPICVLVSGDISHILVPSLDLSQLEYARALCSRQNVTPNGEDQ